MTVVCSLVSRLYLIATGLFEKSFPISRRHFLWSGGAFTPCNDDADCAAIGRGPATVLLDFTGTLRLAGTLHFEGPAPMFGAETALANTLL